MKTAVAAPDFEAHEELRLLLWALLQKKINRLEFTNELLLEFGRQDLRRISDRVAFLINAGDPEP